MKEKYTKKAALAIALGMMFAGSAQAANFISDTAVATSYTPRYIAYEIYDAVNGNNADNVPFFINHDGSFLTDNQLNIKGNGTNFNVSDQVYILARVANVSTGVVGSATAVSAAVSTTCAAAIAPIAIGGNNYYIVADGSQNSSPVNEITAKFLTTDQFCARNAAAAGANTRSSTAVSNSLLATSASTSGLTTAYGTTNATGNTTVKLNGLGVLNLRVTGGLSASCTTTNDIKAAVITSQGNIADTTVLQIRPQFALTAGTGMQNELSTDKDFQAFIINGAAVYTYQATTGSTGSLFSVVDRAAAAPGTYAAAIPTTQPATLQFTLGSVTPETGVTITYGAAPVTACTKSADAKSFACNHSASTVGGITAATYQTYTATNVATNNVYSEMSPTNWTLSAFSFAVPGYTTCSTLLGSNVGNWYGGVEAIVPLMKANANGYETYVKLFNRYSKEAKVYVANMNQVSDSIVTSITQLPAPNSSIPSKSAITISASNLVSANVLTAAEADFGAPIKFLVRVPSQDGGFTTGNGTFTAATTTVATPFDTRNVAKAANVDPYLTGLVVQVVPGGSQRSIPLMFKAFKQGQYN